MNKIKKISLVITSINKPKLVIKKYYSMCDKLGVKFIIIGDKKSPSYPKKYNFYNIKSQRKFDFFTNKSLPLNSYSRKNIGYLIAMKNSSKIITETDDDNYPKNSFFDNLELEKNISLLSGPKWINIFKIFNKTSNEIIWPRGFPLNEITRLNKVKSKKSFNHKSNSTKNVRW